MSYRIILEENISKVDPYSTINLMVEVDGQIFSTFHSCGNNEDKLLIISQCFTDIAEALKEFSKYGNKNKA